MPVPSYVATIPPGSAVTREPCSRCVLLLAGRAVQPAETRYSASRSECQRPGGAAETKPNPYVSAPTRIDFRPLIAQVEKRIPRVIGSIDKETRKQVTSEP